MNGKKAKALRREAEAQTTGWPLVKYDRTTGEPIHMTQYCTRYVYKQLKKAA